ncbi:MAG: MBL fold metallo-hydrolase [Bacteroidetes bacterium]|nr:MBL fold metallo-hydrolase [Bacteroidota bacterium]
MNLQTVSAGYLKLDGGAMFGVVPKTMWSRIMEPDAQNRITWAMRCLLVEEGNRRLLIDTGMGTKQDAKFRAHFEPQGPDVLQSLAALGLAPEDITDVLLTHLHFDHAGGAVTRQADALVPAFPRATYWSHRDQWQWAVQPSPKDKGSFLTENFLPLEQSGQLQFAEAGQEILPGLWVETAFGHTEAMLIPHLRYKNRTLVYLADLQPSVAHFPLPWVMAYDIRPLQTMQERGVFLEKAMAEDYLFFFEHDPVNECCSLQRSDRGIGAKDLFALSELR